MPYDVKAKPHFHGHRSRLRERILGKALPSMLDYELLEVLLCYAISRGDVKPLAKELIDHFGSFAKVITAPKDKLLACKGVGEAIVALCHTIHESSSRLIKEQVIEAPVIGSSKALLDYCRVRMAHADIEQFRVLFLNTKNKLIEDRVLQEGTINETPVYPREVAKQSLLLNASAIIMVHNHPSGEAHPSQADIDITSTIKRSIEIFDIELYDHIIITHKGHFSFKSQGLI